MSSPFQSLILDLISASGLADHIRRRHNKTASIVPLFHGIHSKRYPINPGIQKPDLTIDEFDAVLSFLSQHFSFISPDQFLNGYKGGVLLTFDDGFRNNLSILPVLEKYNAPAIVFVSGQIIKDPVNWLWFTRNRIAKEWENTAEIPANIQADLFDGLGESGLRELALHPLIEIGGHTFTHPYLSTLNDTDMEEEILSSKKYLESVIQKNIRTFSYPLDDYNREVLDLVKSGYESAFAGASKWKYDPQYEYSRIYIHSARKSYLNVKTSRLFS